MPKCNFAPMSFEEMSVIYMRRAGITNRDLAKSLGITEATWYRYRRHAGAMPMSAFVLYCRILNLNSDEMQRTVMACGR